MIIKQRKGRDQVNADALSRIPNQLEDQYCPNYKVQVPLVANILGDATKIGRNF